jgi:hypothetical protein
MIFIFEECILLRLLLIMFKGAVNGNSIFLNVFIKTKIEMKTFKTKN